MSNNKRLICLAMGPLLFALCILLLPSSVFETVAARAAVGTVAWMAFWWVTGPVDYAVTAFLPIALNAVVQMTDMSSVIANYASETILLLLGASILTVSWEETGLDRPNAVVCATVTPIAVSMLKFVGEGDIANSKMGSKLLLYIAYGAGVGGMATPLGGAMNLVTVDYIQQLTGTEYMYVDWVVRFLPLTVLVLAITTVFMLWGVKNEASLGGTKEFFAQEYAKLPKMKREEAVCLVLFGIATALAFTRQLYAAYLPGLKPAYVFIIAGILTFLVTRHEDNSRLMLWKSVEGKIVWELIYIFAGGLAAGTLINGSGAAAAIGTAVSHMGLTGGLMTIFVIITLTLLMSDITSNTATAAVAMPIVISIVTGIGENPIPYIYAASVGVNLSYMLPTSIRAIPVGYGLQPRYMLKEGWKISIAIIVLLSLACWALMTYWTAFSTA